jgi:hypothetical protein
MGSVRFPALLQAQDGRFGPKPVRGGQPALAEAENQSPGLCNGAAFLP